MVSPILTRLSTRNESLIDYINERVLIPGEIKEAVNAVSKVEALSRNHLLLKEDMVAHRVYFINKGSARTFYYHDGKDVTSWIYREGQLITSWSSFYARIPSYENVELTEDTSVCSISYDDLQLLYAQYSKMQAFGRIMVEEQMVFLDYFYKGFMFMAAKEKYDLLLSIFPDVTQRVNLGHIASFLGISQETLSRIRKKK
ncbi:MAG: Crp/Fnr family transcriptional regulator [Chitinophagales bacterium]|nr:Crp/Fnr family transcriptional regulator [Chitinophagales bacterium]